jgi:polysaccharide export outer membrane protein
MRLAADTAGAGRRHSSMIVIGAVLSCALLGTVVPVSAQEPDTASATAQDYPLIPGDAIRLSFWREPDLGGEFQIDESGNVVLPLLGSRRVTGLAGSRLKRMLSQEYQEQLANQEPQIFLLRRVRVLGAVNSPGLYHLDGTMSLGDAVALAGGARSDGKLSSIKVFRDGRQIMSDLDVSARIADQIRSGDQINVPMRSWFARNSATIITALGWAVTTIILVAR